MLTTCRVNGRKLSDATERNFWCNSIVLNWELRIQELRATVKANMAEKEAEKTEVKSDQVVTPWEAKAGEGQTGIDYDKLISKCCVNYC